MAKDPKSKRSSKRKGEDFSDLYQDEVEFDEDDFVDEDEDVLLEDEEDDWEEEEAPGRGRKKDGGRDKSGQPSPVGKLRERLRPRPARPGEQDILQSPIVLGLFGGTLLLMLIGGILWFIIGRQSSQKAFDAAQEKLETGQYAQAIQLFEDFQKVYPTHKLLPQSRIGLGKATILQHISGGAPDWPAGLEALENFIRDFKDEEEFEEIKPDIKQYAAEIAEGSAESAAQTRDRSLLDIPPQALLIAKRYTPDETEANKLEEKIDRLMIVANDAIVKQETYDAAVTRIDEALGDSPPRTLDALHLREGLLNRYPDVESNAKIRRLLQATLEAERKLITPEELERPVSQEDHAGPEKPPVTLITHSQTRSDQQSDGNTVFGLAKGCLFGVDAATGRPIWRRVIGLDTPFFPITIHTETPGVLVFDTNRQELLALAERTGDLIWRLPLQDDLSGAPLEQDNFLYFASPTNRLYKIDIETGTLVGTLRFTQPVLSPPIAAPDGEHLIAVGDRELMYAVNTRELGCVAVSHVGHKRGTGQTVPSVDAPLMKLGDLILLAENDRSDSSLLRVFRMSEPEEPIVQVDSHRVAGQVRDAPVLRGNQLYVPCSGERFYAFTVSDDPNLDDDPDRHALALLSPQKLQTPHDGPMHLLALEGEVWLATSALRRMENNSGTLAIVGEPMAKGVSAQPIQQLGDNLYLARHRPYSSASLMIQFQTETLRTNWGLTMGSSILANSVNGEQLVCVNEEGHVYQLSSENFTGAEAQATDLFQRNPNVLLNLPEDLASPLGAIALEDGSLLTYAGGTEPAAWFITPGARLGRRLAIPGRLQTKPVSIQDGVVLPLENRLHYIPNSPGGRRYDDYTRTIEADPETQESPAQWMHVTRLDEGEIISADSAGVLTRIQFRTDPSPHLFEARKQQLASPVNVPFLAFEGTIVLADADRQLQVLDAASFQVLGSADLGGVATNALWRVGSTVFVETNRSELHAFELKPEPEKLWSLSLENAGLAGSPLEVPSGLLIAKQNGDIWVVDPNTGNVTQRHSLGQTLQGGPIKFADEILVPSLDGSFYPLAESLSSGE